MARSTVLRPTALVLALIVSVLASCQSGPSVQEAIRFVESAEKRLQELGLEAARTAWVQANFITHDTEQLAAGALKNLVAATAELGQQSTRFDGLELPAEIERKLKLLKISLPLAAPRDAAMQAELTQITAAMESLYGKGKYCPEEGECQDLGQLSRTLASSRNPDELLEAWRGWRTVSPPMKEMYQRFVEIANQGSQDLGFADLGALWRSGYDMEPDAFAAELDRLWSQVEPLYQALHCHVRARLADHYGTDVVPLDSEIPAHLLGNMWSQQWGNIYELVAPTTTSRSFDLTEILQQRNVEPVEMVRFGERFFSSLGFAPLPDTFWQRSLFTKPADRDVVCHASAWNVDSQDDLRIKMCIEINAEDFSTIHHELGHNYYQRAYNQQSPLFQGGAHDGFHEGIGDTIGLSITPEYLQQVGLLEQVPDANEDLGLLMRMALDKVAFLPFGLLVDQWRWKVFSETVTPKNYNSAWWELRRNYQGIRPPVERSEEDFDPGAKYHVPGNTPYSRYFLAHILQFQFQRALCDAAGYEGPLHRCSIYNSKEAGSKLNDMLEVGMSRRWPDALEALTGQREADATAILDYFSPLQQWLEEQNQGRSCGW